MTAAAMISDPVLGFENSLLRPAPDREPPYDDEPRRASAGPLDEPLPFLGIDTSEPPAARGPQPGASAVGPPELPPVATFTRRFLVAVIETATGRRNPAQLRSHTSTGVQAGLRRDAGRLDRLGTPTRPAALHSVHVSEPADAVAEVVAVLRVHDRFRAVALRLEGRDGRWRCVRLQIG